MKIIKKTNENHYQWGNGCDAWTLLHLSHAIVKEEMMPPNASEQLHLHQETEQFFYILEGEAIFLLDGEEWTLQANNGILVPKNSPHKIMNRNNDSLRFLVISLPGNSKDRIQVDEM